MPPVREASMKPTAATVLPAPVACSNQKRRSAPGSSGASVDRLLGVLLGDRLLPVLRLLLGGQLLGLLLGRRLLLGLGLLVGLVLLLLLGLIDVVAVLLVAVLLALVAFGLLLGRLLGLGLDLGRVVGVVLRVVFGVGGDRLEVVLGGRLLLGHQLGQRPGEGVHLVRVELGAVAQLRRFVGEQALEPEQEREVAPPLDRGVLGAGVDLGQGGVESTAARGALGQRLRPLAVEQEGLAGKGRRALDLGACGNCRCRGNFAGVGHCGFGLRPR